MKGGFKGDFLFAIHMYTPQISSEPKNHSDPLIVAACDVRTIYLIKGPYVHLQPAFAARHPVSQGPSL